MKDETLNEKRRRFLDMQEHPENYTEDDIVQLLADEDVRLFARDLAMTKRAIVSGESAEVDVDGAWRDFARQHLGSRRRWMRVAASTVGIVLLSGVAFAAMVRLGLLGSDTPTTRHQESIPTEQVATADTTLGVTTTPRDSVDMIPVTFENAELSTILAELGRFYHVQVRFRENHTARMRLYFRWDKHRSLAEQVELLNAFERINITLDGQTLNVD